MRVACNSSAHIESDRPAGLEQLVVHNQQALVVSNIRARLEQAEGHHQRDAPLDLHRRRKGGKIMDPKAEETCRRHDSCQGRWSSIKHVPLPYWHGRSSAQVPFPVASSGKGSLSTHARQQQPTALLSTRLIREGQLGTDLLRARPRREAQVGGQHKDEAGAVHVAARLGGRQPGGRVEWQG